jgi:hypothetical protein
MKKEILILIIFSFIAFFAYGQNIEVPVVKKPATTTPKPAQKQTNKPKPAANKPAKPKTPTKATKKPAKNTQTTTQKPAAKQPAKPKPVGTNGQWVDLGLPSGLLWCDRNIGASSPEDYGYYFAWGETSTKSTYNWSTYRYSNDDGKLTKYCYESRHGNNGYTDDLTTLQSCDDAAAYHKGSGARMPTKDECRELLDNTTIKWTTRKGVNGRLFTSKINGNSIFLPAAGICREGYPGYGGVAGYYWSSSLKNDDTGEAWNIGFTSDKVWMGDRNGRDYGESVRPVCDAKRLSIVKTESKVPLYTSPKQAFDVIAGTYRDKQSAMKMASKLRKRGAGAYVIERGGLYYVSAASAPSRLAADSVMYQLKTWYEANLSIKQW